MLNKSLCLQCYCKRKTTVFWGHLPPNTVESFNLRWEHDILFCYYRIIPTVPVSHIEIGSHVFDYNSTVYDAPPERCPYVLEQLMASQNEACHAE